MTMNAIERLSLIPVHLCRIEPTCRFSWDDDATRAAAALSAEIHDPLWTLHRQWQMGEFKGEDAAAPCSVEINKQELPLVQWWPGASAGDVAQARPISSASGVAEAATTGEPLPLEVDKADNAAHCCVAEAATTGEPFPLDTRARVELGRLFLTSLRLWACVDAMAAADRAAFLRRVSALLLPSAPLKEPEGDAAAARLVRRVAATVPDGGTILESVLADLNAAAMLLQAQVPVAAPHTWTVPLSTFQAAAQRLLGLGAGGLSRPADPARPAASPSWDVSRLDHRLVVATEGNPGQRVVLRVDPDADGALDWYAFEIQHNPNAAWSAEGTSYVGIPGRVKLAGSPSPRWWDIEDSARSLVALDLDVGTSAEDAKNHSSARLAWLDFQLVHGLDWFMLAVPAAIGSVVRIDKIVVNDVFGCSHEILPATPGSGDRRWSMFRSGADTSDRRVLVVAPTTANLHDPGAPIEQLRFARDEAANLVWAISQILPDALSRGRRVDRSSVERPDERTVYRSDQQPPALRYVPQTGVPRGWLPFLPMQIKPGSEQIRLQRAAVAGADGRRYSASPSPLLATPPGEPLYLREESIPRGGVRVLRRPVRARDLAGNVVVWVRRGSEVGSGEVSSGLRFDLAVNDDGKQG